MTIYPWYEGFEYTTTATTRFDVMDSSQVYGSFGRRSGRGLKVVAANGALHILSKYVDAIAALYVGFWYHRKTVSPYSLETFYFRPDQNASIVAYNCKISIKGDASLITVYDKNGVSVATYTIDYTQGNYFEFYCATSGAFKLWVNDGLVIDLIGEDFAAGDIMAFSHTDTDSGPRDPAAYMDDFYLNDSARLGDLAIEYSVPTSDVKLDFAPSTGVDGYPLVDEQAPDDADYVQSANSGDKAIFGTTVNFNSIVGDVLSVNVIGRVNVPDGGTGVGIIPNLRELGADYTSTEVEGTIITKGYVEGRYTINPATGATFTKAEVEAIQGFGWEIGS